MSGDFPRTKVPLDTAKYTTGTVLTTLRIDIVPRKPTRNNRSNPAHSLAILGWNSTPQPGGQPYPELRQRADKIALMGFPPMNARGVNLFSIMRDMHSRGRKFLIHCVNVVHPSPLHSFHETIALHSEDFAGPANNLNGMTPDVTTTAANWTAPTTAVFSGDGSLSGTTSSTAHLPFSPQHGFIYTLTATIEMGTTGGTSWAAFGFLRTSPGTGEIHTGAPAGGIVWALTRNDSVNPDQVLHENIAGGTGLVVSGDYVTGASLVNMALVLDTTGGTGNWKYDWLVDGTARITARALPASFESAIGGIGIAKHNSLSPHAFRSFALSRQ